MLHLPFVAGLRPATLSRFHLPLIGLLLLTVMGGGLFGQEYGDPAPVIAPVNTEAGHLVTPGASTSLSVQVTDGGGAPQAGVMVIFAGPGEGTGGTFPASQEADQTVLRAQTDGNGVATAEFVANDAPGVFLVEAMVEDQPASTSFAFTNRVEAPTPMLTAAAVRTAVHNQLLNGVALGQTIQLHGPVLVPAGAEIGSSGQPESHFPFEPLVTEQESWLLWIDYGPGTVFSHATKWVVVDAADASGNAVANALVRDEGWWPWVFIDGAPQAYSLFPPGASNPAVHPVGDDFPLVPLEAKAAGARFAVDPKDACAILMYGPDLPGANIDTIRYRNHLVNSGKVPAENVFANARQLPDGRIVLVPVSAPDIVRLIKAAAAKGCKKVYFQFSTHGMAGGTGGGVQVRNDVPGQPHQVITYEALVEAMKELGGIELCIFQGSCFSGQMVRWIQGHGFTGSIITAASEDKVGFSNPAGGVVLICLIAVKQDPEKKADADKDGTITDEEAIVWIRANKRVPGRLADGTQIEDMIGFSNPQVGGISPAGTREMLTADVYIPEPGQTRYLVVRRPSFVPKNTRFTVEIKLATAGIATLQTDELTLDENVEGIRLLVRGDDCGVTTYTFEGADASGQKYEGRGLIQVGDFRAKPKKITVNVNTEFTIELERYGRSLMPGVPGVDTSTTFETRSLNENVAKPEKATVDAAKGQTMLSFKARAGSTPGKTRILIRDRKTRSVKWVEVEVVAPPAVVEPSNACDALDQEIDFGFNIYRDNNFHGPFVNAPNRIRARVIVEPGPMMETGTIRFRSSVPQLVDLDGTVNCENGNFMAEGNSGMTPIANFINVPGEVEGNIEILNGDVLENGVVRRFAGAQPRRAEVGAISFLYTLGTDVFPGEPIVYMAEGSIESGCAYVLDPENEQVQVSGGTRRAQVAAADGCEWTAASDVPWIGFLNGATGTGTGSFDFWVAANPDAGAREGRISLNGQVLIVQQDGTSSARPVILASGVANGASFVRGIASATWITIVGSNLSTTTRLWGDADFNGANLPVELDGVSVTVNGLPAYIYYVSPAQLNVLTPDDEFIGPLEIVVSNAGGSSDAYTVVKLETDPALFTFTQGGGVYPAAVHADGTLVGWPGLIPGADTRWVVPGDIILLFGTGFGPTSPPTPTGQLVAQATPLATPVTVRIGGKRVQVLWAGIVSSGLYQFNILVPPDLEFGDNSLEVFVDGIPIQTGMFITAGQ